MMRPLGTARASLLAVGVLLAVQIPQKALAADMTPPSTPSNLVWTSDDQTVTLSWDASTDDVGVAGYDLKYGSLYLGTFSGTSLALFGFKAGTPYVFTVSARDDAGNLSVASNQVTVLLQGPPDTQPPSAPSGLTATSVTSRSVGLRWTGSTDNVGVVVYQVFANGALAATVPSSTATTISSLNAATTYSFTVTAVDGAGNVSQPSTALSVTTATPPDTTAPSAPSGLAASSVTTSSLVLSWTASSDNVAVTGYQVYSGSNLVASTSTTSAALSSLAAGTTYSFTVVALDAAGNVSSASSALSVKTTSLGGGGGGGVQGGGGGGGGGPIGGETCSTNDALGLTAYMLENNSQYNSHLPPSAQYNKFSMCVSGSPASDGTANVKWTWDWPIGEYVKERATPTIVYGFKPENSASSTPNLPARVANVGSLTIDSQVAQTLSSDAKIQFGVVAYLTSSNQKASGAASLPVVGKLFIYRNYYGMQYSSSQGQVTIDGVVWDYDAWYFLGVQYMRYSVHSDPSVPATSLHLDVADFLKDASARNLIQSDWWLASAETLDLVFEGAGSTTLTGYNVQFQGK